MNDIVVSEQRVETPDGWSLHLKRTACPARVQAGAGPLLIVPGYGMNSFIFGFHPRGTSMERTLAEAGLEVWSLDLRAQGRSRPARDRPGPVSLRGYAAIDLPAAVERVLSATATGADRLALIGASLGGSIAYAYLALRPEPRLDALVTMGAPLRWRGTHPVVRLAFGSPRVAAAVRLKHTRTLVRAALPLLTRVPRLLSMYMNAATIDLSRMHEMTRTVDDPSPNVNRELAEWLHSRDIVLDGVNVTAALARVDLPLLVVLANRDGIVPETTALTAAEAWGGGDVEVLRVGDEHNWFAHANLFVADDAPALVFQPIIRWLARRRAAG